MSITITALNREGGSVSTLVESLNEKADAYAAKSKGEGTRDAYRKAWRAYVRWCASVELEPLAGNPDTLALYVTARASDLSVSSINVIVAAIQEAHRLGGVALDMGNPRLSMVLEGIRRSRGIRPQRKAAPATPDVLRRLLATRRPPSSPVGARDRAMMLLGFGAAMRRSELVGLLVGDVRVEPGRGLIVTIRHSKTDQVGAGVEVSVCENRDDDSFCPATAFSQWMEHRRLAQDGGGDDRTLFCSIDEVGRLSGRHLNAHMVARLMNSAAKAAGLPVGDYSGHSLRRGFATAAARSGVGLPELMRHTRHKSTQVAVGYIEEADRWRSNASESVWGGKN
jgi:integrase